MDFLEFGKGFIKLERNISMKIFLGCEAQRRKVDLVEMRLGWWASAKSFE